MFMSSLPISIRAMICANSGLVSIATNSSATDKSPDPSTSSSSQIFITLTFMTSYSRALSSSFLFSSASRAEFATSIITVIIKFTIPNSTITRTPKRNTETKGSSSMIGIESNPQLSPAMICCRKVSVESITVENARGHLSQSCQTPCSANRVVIGCTTSTAMIEKKMRHAKIMQVAQNIARIALMNPWSMRSSSLNNRKNFMQRNKRTSLHTRKTATDGKSPMRALTTKAITSAATTLTSSRFHIPWKNCD
mmetsp:Transcript_82403/g.214721  ORF Transcript_82403/g.214721 Transcript_82403/m.214721 type:complete len:252 (+) Transcript_82403:747-1502(+)